MPAATCACRFSAVFVCETDGSALVFALSVSLRLLTAARFASHEMIHSGGSLTGTASGVFAVKSSSPRPCLQGCLRLGQLH